MIADLSPVYILSIILLLILLALTVAGLTWNLWLSKKLGHGDIPPPLKVLTDDDLEAIANDARLVTERAARIEARAVRLRFKQMEKARLHETRKG